MQWLKHQKTWKKVTRTDQRKGKKYTCWLSGLHLKISLCKKRSSGLHFAQLAALLAKPSISSAFPFCRLVGHLCFPFQLPSVCGWAMILPPYSCVPWWHPEVSFSLRSRHHMLQVCALQGLLTSHRIYHQPAPEAVTPVQREDSKLAVVYLCRTSALHSAL